MNKYLLVVFIPLLALLGSCTESSQQEQEQTVSTDTIVEPDTLSIEQQVAEWEANDTLYHAFLDADEALLYMENRATQSNIRRGFYPEWLARTCPIASV